MLNFHIRKIILKSGDTRYRTIITKSGKGIKSKTFRRKADPDTGRMFQEDGLWMYGKRLD